MKMTQILSQRKIDAERRHHEWELEQQQIKRRIARVLNAAPQRHCAMCGGQIDRNHQSLPPYYGGMTLYEERRDRRRRYLNEWDKEIEERFRKHDPNGYADKRVRTDGLASPEDSAETLLVLSRLCLPCFRAALYNFRHRDTTSLSAKMVLETTRLLRGKDVRKDLSTQPIVRSQDRQTDLLVLILSLVRSRYSRGDCNREISNRSYDLNSTAEYWKASAVYRRLRKQLGVKGKICKGIDYIKTVFHQHWLFLGPDILDLEITFRGDPWAGLYKHYYVWQENAVRRLLFTEVGQWTLFSFEIAPLSDRLAHFKRVKREREEWEKTVGAVQRANLRAAFTAYDP